MANLCQSVQGLKINHGACSKLEQLPLFLTAESMAVHDWVCKHK